MKSIVCDISIFLLYIPCFVVWIIFFFVVVVVVLLGFFFFCFFFCFVLLFET